MKRIGQFIVLRHVFSCLGDVREGIEADDKEVENVSPAILVSRCKANTETEGKVSVGKMEKKKKNSSLAKTHTKEQENRQTIIAARLRLFSSIEKKTVFIGEVKAVADFSFVNFDWG